MKLECEDDIFLHDPEGQTLAAAINQHLPEQVPLILHLQVEQEFIRLLVLDDFTVAFPLWEK